MDPVEIIWEQLLSRDAEQVSRAYRVLDAETRLAVSAHLRRMTSEEGWHPEQAVSAQAALDIIAGIEGA